MFEVVEVREAVRPAGDSVSPLVAERAPMLTTYKAITGVGEPFPMVEINDSFMVIFHCWAGYHTTGAKAAIGIAAARGTSIVDSLVFMYSPFRKYWDTCAGLGFHGCPNTFRTNE
jgi:hypothetical protein